MPKLTLQLIALLLAMLPLSVAIAESPSKSNDVVLWISLDGLRSDYLERAKTPELHRLMKSGVYSLQLEPIFPSITFPSHISQATGVRVSQHGIPSNAFYDLTTGRLHRYPAYGTLLLSEPIWLTAARQKLRVASMDWPLSHSQRGAVKAEYFEMKFEADKTDEERLDRVLEVWRDDKHEQPLRLIMGYVVGTDKPGHEHGPESREVIEEMQALDTLLGRFINDAIKIFEKQRRGDEQLYVLLTTDHGMSQVHTLVHMGYLAEVEGRKGIEMTTAGNVGDIYFAKDMPDREAAIQGTLDRLKSYKFARAWTRETLPKEWELSHPTRGGDIVIVLEKGYTFSRTGKEAISPVTAKGPLGMHGYHPGDNADMLGPMILWRYPTPMPAQQLGRVGALQLHPTVCELLGIKPSDKAQGKPIAFER